MAAAESHASEVGPSRSAASGSGPLGPLRRWITVHRAPIALVVLAVTIPEVLSGSTPVPALINPVQLVGLLGFYGAGVLVIRDAAIRFRRGWSMILPLGLAYGIAEEGIATKTMVDPASHPAGFLGTYGHWLGVNWVFAVVIALFHAIYSIALPILLVRLLYPETVDRPFLSERGVITTLVLFSLAVAIGYFAFDPTYFEGYAVLAGLAVAIGALVLLAFQLPRAWLDPPTDAPTLSPRRFGYLGAAYASGWAFFYLFAPRLIPVPAVVVAGEIATGALALAVVVRSIGRTRHERHLVMLSAGLLSWFVPWAIVITFVLGDYLVGFVVFAVFFLVYRLAQRYPDVTLPPPAAPLRGSVDPGRPS